MRDVAGQDGANQPPPWLPPLDRFPATMATLEARAAIGRVVPIHALNDDS
jgi:hypothetical protein